MILNTGASYDAEELDVASASLPITNYVPITTPLPNGAEIVGAHYVESTSTWKLLLVAVAATPAT